MDISMGEDEIKSIKCFPEMSAHSLPPHAKDLNKKDRKE